MKLIRFGDAGNERPGLIDEDGDIRDLSAYVDDISSESLKGGIIDKIANILLADLPKINGNPRMGPCVAGVGKFMCIGLNYSDHAAETGAKIPDHPILFMKATSAIIGANDMVIMPRASSHTDWEVELAVIIGKPAKYVSKDNALDYVAGYCISNDISERHYQKAISGQWTKGKSCDTFGPIGPWLVTKDEVPDPQNLDMSLHVNGELMQSGNSKNMIFTVAEIIEHLSHLFTLHPGDVISTGTPPGVGMGRIPEKYLKTGDVMEVSIQGLGTQRQQVSQD